MDSAISKVVRVAFTLVMVITCLLVVVVSPFVSFTFKTFFCLPNVLLLLMGLAVLVACFMALHGSGRISCFRGESSALHHKSRIIAVLTLALFLLQVRVVWSYCFFSGWDSGVVSSAAWSFASGDDWPIDKVSYFSTYPNNLFLLWVVAGCMRVGMALGGNSPVAGLNVFVFLNCLMSACAAFLVWKLLSSRLPMPFPYVGWFLFELETMLSPWVSIIYSDSLSAVFPVAMLYLYVRSCEERGAKAWIRWLLIGFVGLVGYRLKPQASFVLIALILIKLCEMLENGWLVIKGRKRSRDSGGAHLAAPVRLARETMTLLQPGHGAHLAHTSSRSDSRSSVLGCLAGVVLGGTLAFALTSSAVASLDIPIRADSAFGPAHYLMMGARDDTTGVYSEEDVQFSRLQDSAEGRTRADLAEWAHRVSELGPIGYVSLMAKKAMLTFGDGTFAWAFEGYFYYGLPAGGPGDRLGKALMLAYYEGAPLWDAWRAVSQAVWLSILVLTACAGLKGGVPAFGKGSNPLIVAMVAIMGLMLFEMVFEARARYLYCSLSLFCLLATWGIWNVWSRVSPLLAKRNRCGLAGEHRSI